MSRGKDKYREKVKFIASEAWPYQKHLSNNGRPKNALTSKASQALPKINMKHSGSPKTD